MFKLNSNRGNGHFPLCRSSSLNFFSTSWKRCSSAVTASRPATPPSAVFVLLLLLLSSNSENCNNVSKHVLANSSRNFKSESQPKFDDVAECMEPLFRMTTTFSTNWCGISCECGSTSSRNNSITWQSIVSSRTISSMPRSSIVQTLRGTNGIKITNKI